MPNYDLSSYGAICDAVQEVKKAENVLMQAPAPHDPATHSFLSGYRTALEDVSKQLAPQQRLLDTLIGYLGEHHDSSELYRMFHNEMGMTDEEIAFLGFDLPEPEKENPKSDKETLAHEIKDPAAIWFIHEIRKQINNRENETAYGEPQAWVGLSNGRTIEVTLEQEGLAEKDYFFSVRLHCNEKEYENHDYNTTEGVIGQFTTSGSSLEELDRQVQAVFSCNEQFPVAEHSLMVRELDKMSIAKDIGRVFGDYFEENNQLCIDNGENVFRYDTVDALLKDWLDTIIESHHDEHHIDEKGGHWDSWEDEIVFIYENVIGQYPDGIQCIPGSNVVSWSSSVDVPSQSNDSVHKETLDLGTYLSIVDAIYAQKEFQEAYENNKIQNLGGLADIAEQIREKSTARKKLSFVDEIGYTEFEVSAIWYEKRADINAADLYHMACADDSSCLNDLTGKYYEEKPPLSDQIQPATVRAAGPQSPEERNNLAEPVESYKSFKIFSKNGSFTIGGEGNVAFDDCTLENLGCGVDESVMVEACRCNGENISFQDLLNNGSEVSYEQYLGHLEKYQSGSDRSFLDDEFIVPVVTFSSLDRAKEFIDFLSYEMKYLESISGKPSLASQIHSAAARTAGVQSSEKELDKASAHER